MVLDCVLEEVVLGERLERRQYLVVVEVGGGMSSSTTQASTYAEIAYSIKDLCTEFGEFVASKSLAGAACGDWRR